MKNIPIKRKVFFILLLLFFTIKSFSNDTLKIYVIGCTYFHSRLYIQDQNSLKIIKVNGFRFKSVNLILNDSLDLAKKKFYYKYGLFSKKKVLNIPKRNNMKYLQVNFHVDEEKKTCTAKWRNDKIYHE